MDASRLTDAFKVSFVHQVRSARIHSVSEPKTKATAASLSFVLGVCMIPAAI